MNVARDLTPLPPVLTDGKWTHTWRICGADENSPLDQTGRGFRVTMAPARVAQPPESDVHTFTTVTGEVTVLGADVTITLPGSEVADWTPAPAYVVELSRAAGSDWEPMTLAIAPVFRGAADLAARGGGGALPAAASGVRAIITQGPRVVVLGPAASVSGEVQALAIAAAGSAGAAADAAGDAGDAAALAARFAVLDSDYAAAADNSAKSWAVGGSGNGAPAGGSAKDWATKIGVAVAGSLLSAKEWAVGVVARGQAGGGSAKDWATLTGATVDDAGYSAKAHASDTTDTGSAKDWATKIGAAVAGGLLSAKEWAVGVVARGQAGGGSAKDWATFTGATVDDAGYSAKAHASGTTDTGSAKDWATKTAAEVVPTQGYGAKKYAQDAAASALAAANSEAAVSFPVSYHVQTLNGVDQAQARANIGAVDAAYVTGYGVAKAGDTMTGPLVVPQFGAVGEYLKAATGGALGARLEAYFGSTLRMIFNGSRVILGSGLGYGWSSASSPSDCDTAFTRVSPGVAGLGTGSAGATDGTLQLANLTAGNNVNLSSGGGATANAVKWASEASLWASGVNNFTLNMGNAGAGVVFAFTLNANTGTYKFEGRSGFVLGWNASNIGTGATDVAFSRAAAGVLALGTGAAGSVGGTLRLGQLELGSSSGAKLIPDVAGVGRLQITMNGNGALYIGEGGSPYTCVRNLRFSTNPGPVAADAGISRLSAGVLQVDGADGDGLGLLKVGSGSASGAALQVGAAGTGIYSPGASQVSVAIGGSELANFQANAFWLKSATAEIDLGLGADIRLVREGAGAFAQRNGANAQTFRLYETTDAGVVNYSRLSLGYSATYGGFAVLSEKGGTGTLRNVVLVGNNIQFAPGVLGIVWTINASGHLVCAPDNNYDIGGTSNSRPRDVNVARDVNVGRNVIIAGYYKSGPYTVATLPSASAAGAGAKTTVTDATSTSPGGAVVGGGSNVVDVISTGSAWNVA